MRFCFGISVIVCCFVYVNAAEFRQDRAQLEFCNEKYIRNCSVFTGRTSRHALYLTNMTGSILDSWGNNITIVINFDFESGVTFKLTYKACEALNVKWIQDFLNTFSNIGRTCPVPSKTYWFYNMELPPKNIPLPTSQGDYTITLELILTHTLEKIAWGKISIHLDKKKRNYKPK